ncbi:AAA family ATPase [Haloferula sp. BvORR071]|uniref:AAA family ATPase n=1 Tax=Haloferula sp. BvORR071 TaxID=1396141 RepID=UPI000557C23F|nr:AAA family ATPase [Haloferula sp. BvORR071]
MRLLSLTVRNYRIHRETTVAFDRARTLLGGANQSGKSTLVEAAHRALFLRAKTGGSLQQEMVSKLHHDAPEVILSFEAAGAEWQVEKKFAGTKGSTRLTGPGGLALKDDEAETKLSELLKSDIAGGRGAAGQLPTLWSHLWVWQGSSGDDPGEHAGRHKDTLVRRLQQDGVAAVMQSGLDQQVRDRIAAEYLELFTASTGKLKASSRAEIARDRHEKARVEQERAAGVMERMESAVADHASAAQQLATAEAALPGLQEQLQAVEEKLKQVAELKQQEEKALRVWETAAAALKSILDQDTRIRELQQQIAAAKEALQPMETAEARLVTEDQSAANLAREAEQTLRAKTDAIRLARQRHDLAVALVDAGEKEEARVRLAERAKEAEALSGERNELLEKWSKLPALTAQEIRNLRKLDQDAGQALAALRAIATGIELVAGGKELLLDGMPLPVGELRILTDTAELTTADGTRLRIRPGGGTSLADAKSQGETAVRAFADALQRHALADLDAAVAAFEQRQNLEQQGTQVQARWKAMGGETLAAELSKATSAASVAKAELERRRAALGEEKEAVSLAAAKEELHTAEQAETTARKGEEQFRTRREAAAKSLEEQRQRLTRDKQALRDLETKLKVIEDSHGEPAAREAALSQARTAERETGLQLAALRQGLKDLAPELLAGDKERFGRAITQQETSRRNAQDRALTAGTLLRLDGSSDPQADLLHATARVESTRQAYESELRRAKAIEKLHKLFASSGEAIDRSLVQPLADRISGYVQCLYGPAATVQMTLAEDGKAGLELLCPGMPAFGFGTLSGGTREQVAAALRLAMAEILAADHDGCLPVVFDDAFAYVDPERIQVLQRMLDLAAARGLQVIVFACNPGDYSGLGAVETRI